MDRPALKRLLADVEAGLVDCICVYKVDRPSRSLLDFSRIIGTLDAHGVSFVSITQQFATTTAMGKLTLNILLSFAEFERGIIAERTRDKMSAARRKGKWTGGPPILGYDVDPAGGRLLVNESEAQTVRTIFELYLDRQSLLDAARELNRLGLTTKRRTTRHGVERGGQAWDKTRLGFVLQNLLTPATLGSGCWPALPGGTWTRRVAVRGFKLVALLSSFPGLCLAHTGFALPAVVETSRQAMA